jgi:hypothetical protein
MACPFPKEKNEENPQYVYGWKDEVDQLIKALSWSEKGRGER